MPSRVPGQPASKGRATRAVRAANCGNLLESVDAGATDGFTWSSMGKCDNTKKAAGIPH